jgi:hypothetical protein
MCVQHAPFKRVHAMMGCTEDASLASQRLDPPVSNTNVTLPLRLHLDYWEGSNAAIQRNIGQQTQTRFGSGSYVHGHQQESLGIEQTQGSAFNVMSKGEEAVHARHVSNAVATLARHITTRQIKASLVRPASHNDLGRALIGVLPRSISR